MSVTATHTPAFGVAQVTLDTPQPRLGLALRAVVRALSGMQKEALVSSSEAGLVWRLLCDEGPYLAGTDLAPPPLGFFATGMVCAYANALLALASSRGIQLRDVRLTQDTFYSMEGSALRGTMTGGALTPVLRVRAACELSEPELQSLTAEAVAACPLAGLISEPHESLFSLVHNGVPIPTGRVAELPGGALVDPRPAFDLARVAAVSDEPLLRKLQHADRVKGEGGEMSSLRSEQSRTLNARAICVIRPDGVKQIDQHLLRPIGSQFRMLSDEQGRAPDAFSYVAAGIGFCFMTQIGRYAAITKQQLDDYRVIQDTHFSTGGCPGAPVETHVFLDTPASHDGARAMLDMGEQTCFLHALCRTELAPQVQATVPAA